MQAEGLPRRELFVVLGSLDDRFDPALRIVDYDAAWPALAEAEPILDLLLSVAVIESRARKAEGRLAGAQA